MRSIFGKFTIPLYYGYDEAMKKDVILDVIKKVEKWGYHVKGLTCDNYVDNTKLSKALGVTNEKPYFPHPTRPEENIYFMFDPVHILKLLRNHLIDQGKLKSRTLTDNVIPKVIIDNSCGEIFLLSIYIRKLLAMKSATKLYALISSK